MTHQNQAFHGEENLLDILMRVLMPILGATGHRKDDIYIFPECVWLRIFSRDQKYWHLSHSHSVLMDIETGWRRLTTPEPEGYMFCRYFR